MKGKGFDRLRGVAAAGAMGLGLLGGASAARGATKSTPIVLTVSDATWFARWGYSFGPPTNTTAGIRNMYTYFVTDPNLTKTPPQTTFFAIEDAKLGTTGKTYTDAYDGAFGLFVDGVAFVNPDGTVDLTGTTVTSDVVVLSGLQTQIQYYFIPNRPVLRALYSFTNPTGSPISASAIILGELGSDGQTTVQGTSDGDLVIENSDNWYVSNDNTTVGGPPNSDPVFSLSRFGKGDVAVIPSYIARPGTPAGCGSCIDNFSEKYEITVSPGETVRILIFSEMSPTNAGAIAGAADFETLEAARAQGLLTGLSETELSQIVNYEQLDTLPVPTLGQWGMMFLSGFLGLFGVGALRKRKKR